MAKLRDYFEHYKQIRGYIRRLALTDNDYDEALSKFEEIELIPPQILNSEIIHWLHYQSDIFMLSYYYDYNQHNYAFNKTRIKQKIRYLYDKIRSCYPEFYDQSDLLKYEEGFELPSYITFGKHISAITDSGYPHQVLVFCYRVLIDKWEISRITEELSENSLESMFNLFINEYSDQSGLPVFIINLYFINMKGKLNFKLKSIISKNDSCTAQRLDEYINWITGWTILNFYFGKNKEHDISDWCNKVKSKALRKIIHDVGK